MQQPHKNLFFYYRGAHQKSTHYDLVLERQLEDNATKALIYVLEHTDRTAVLGPFLQEIASIRNESHLDKVQFALQRSDIGRPAIARRIALSIAPDRTLDETRGDSHESGRPDAWIWQENRFAIFIETKIHGQTTRAQINRHISTAVGWKQGNVEVRPTSWAEVYLLLEKIRRSSRLDGITKILLSEIVRYIRMIGLSGTTTFDLDDFGYFMLPIPDREDTQRSLLQEKLDRFAEDLSRSPTMRRLIKKYAGKATRLDNFVHPGVFRKDAKNYWITVGKKERRDRCHFTVRLNEQGITLEAFSPHKSYTRKLVEKIRRKPSEFVAALKPMIGKEPYFLRLREAYYHNPSSQYKGRRIGEFVDYMVFHPSVVTTENIESLIIGPIEHRLERRDLRPEFFVVREFPLSQLVGRSGVIDLVASTAEKMSPFFKFALEL